MFVVSRSVGAVACAVAVIAFAACDRSTSTEPAIDHLSHHASAAKSPNATASAGLAKAVHAGMARYHSTTQAEKNGYVTDPFCVEAPGLGGMGHHWVNGALVDPVFDPARPEVVLYAPDKHGNMKLVAVEYIVINTGQPAPTFDGHPFDVGGTPIQAPHWSLHVWLYQSNPSGLHAPFNPTIDCP